MNREQAIKKLEEAQEGMPGPYGQAIRMALKDMRTMQKIEDSLKDTDTDTGCEGGACRIRFMEDDGR